MGAFKRVASSFKKASSSVDDDDTTFGKPPLASSKKTTTNNGGYVPPKKNEFTFTLPSSADERDQKWDVIIVGAGVAGASLACVLGNEGRKVLCVERDTSGSCYNPGGIRN